ncbi:MAG TPA: hypothetical protein PKA88_01190 [Polyangiaceae bacterium]|nr:hypothetical protein [Polyangiaceae bacterium]HMR76745.1 hypothetical protein [Polyangiaceae bacterium]
MSQVSTERRIHKMFVTRNTEYHFRSGICIAVRDRRSGSWLPAHLALRRTLAGRVCFQPNGVALPNDGEPQVGEALYFGGDGRDLVTSLLCDVERPPKKLVEEYPDPAPFLDCAC